MFLIRSYIYVTGFEKTRLSHTSNFLTLMPCNFLCEYANDLKLLHRSVVAYRNDIDMLKFTHASCMLVWCDLHVARNVLCTAISRAVVINTRDFTKILGTSHKTHACTALASVKLKSSCTVYKGT